MKNKTIMVMSAAVVILVAIAGALYLKTRKKEIVYADAIYVDLVFDKEIVRLYRKDLGSDKDESFGDWWGKEARILTTSSTQKTLIELILNNKELLPGAFAYVQGFKTYVSITPGGFDSMKLVELKDIVDKGQSKKEYSDSSADVDTRFECSETTPSSSAHPAWKEVTCTSFHKFSDSKEEFDDGVRKTCYVPVQNSSKWLEFAVPVTSAGSDVDNCSYLVQGGVLGSVMQ